MDDKDFRIPALVLWACVIAMFLMLEGCATTPGELEQAQANATPVPGYPAYVQRVKDVHSACVNIGTRVAAGGRVLGCADPYGRILRGLCAVIVPLDDPGWIEEHERLHCVYGRFHNEP
jgi:starvation-inducible outer membrane lipoprotein